MNYDREEGKAAEKDKEAVEEEEGDKDTEKVTGDSAEEAEKSENDEQEDDEEKAEDDEKKESSDNDEQEDDEKKAEDDEKRRTMKMMRKRMMKNMRTMTILSKRLRGGEYRRMQRGGEFFLNLTMMKMWRRKRLKKNPRKLLKLHVVGLRH
ncbi:hypothetical protein F2Q69_00015214 [Brassica cretica]|uniref:Uncharacterized protein n=1 Tax=Brassica cretica TaxID=69181 RepID=A0A8S9QR26_BRACR|nr:hypothetical protein F2Q69_00015214 [Brassica cretica]